MIEGPKIPPIRVCLERNAQCFKGSLQLPGRKKPLRHLIGMSEELILVNKPFVQNVGSFTGVHRGRGIQGRALSQQRSLAKITEQYRDEPAPAKALRLPRICVGKTSRPISTRGGLQRARRKRAASAHQILLSSRNESRRQSPQNKCRDAVYASASRRDGESSLPSK